MVGEVFAGFSAAKAAFDIAKGLKDLDDRTHRNAAVIELQEQILAAQAEQGAAIERIRDLEKQVADFEKWDAEKKRYELKNVVYACFCLYAEARDSRQRTTAFRLCKLLQPAPNIDHSTWVSAGGRESGIFLPTMQNRDKAR